MALKWNAQTGQYEDDSTPSGNPGGTAQSQQDLVQQQIQQGQAQATYNQAVGAGTSKVQPEAGALNSGVAKTPTSDYRSWTDFVSGNKNAAKAQTDRWQATADMSGNKYAQDQQQAAAVAQAANASAQGAADNTMRISYNTDPEYTGVSSADIQREIDELNSRAVPTSQMSTDISGAGLNTKSEAYSNLQALYSKLQADAAKLKDIGAGPVAGTSIDQALVNTNSPQVSAAKQKYAQILNWMGQINSALNANKKREDEAIDEWNAQTRPDTIAALGTQQTNRIAAEDSAAAYESSQDQGVYGNLFGVDHKPNAQEMWQHFLYKSGYDKKYRDYAKVDKDSDYKVTDNLTISQFYDQFHGLSTYQDQMSRDDIQKLGQIMAKITEKHKKGPAGGEGDGDRNKAELNNLYSQLSDLNKKYRTDSSGVTVQQRARRAGF